MADGNVKDKNLVPDTNAENYNKLNAEQRLAYDQICESIEKKKPAIVWINAPAGTGKTFLLITLAQRYKNNMQFLTYTNRETASIVSKLDENAEVYTYERFYVRCLKLGYKEAEKEYETWEQYPDKLLANILQHSKNYRPFNTNIIIVDNCTIIPTNLLFLLFLLSQMHGIHLIFAGDNLQLSPIQTSPLHNRNNVDLISKISNVTITDFSNVQPHNNEILSQFYTMILQNGEDKRDCSFHYLYYMFCCFRSKYFADENFEAMFIAQYHRVITDRLNRFIEYLNKAGTTYFVVPFHAVSYGKMARQISTTIKDKFFPGLILAEGHKYIHVDPRGEQEVVRLQKIEPSDDGDFRVTVCSFQDGRTFHVERCNLTYYQILSEYRNWLVRDGEDLYQFPLHHYTSTYHAAAGQTLQIDSIELDTDCCANAIYATLRNTSNFDKIKKIHGEADLLSFLVTDYMRNEHNDYKYYYSFPWNPLNLYRDHVMTYVSKENGRILGINDYIETIKWETVDNVNTFEQKRMKSFVRIPVALYVQQGNQLQNQGNTCFMLLVDYITNYKKKVLL